MEIQYKGFIGKILFSADTCTFFGEVLNSKKLIVFMGSSIQEAEQAFKNAIDQLKLFETLASCRQPA